MKCHKKRISIQVIRSLSYITVDSMIKLHIKESKMEQDS